MKGVAATFRGHVNLSGTATELSGVNAGLHLEFLQRFGGREDYVGVEVGVGIFDAIESEAVIVVALTGNGNVLVGAVTTLAAIGLSSAREPEADVGRQTRKGEIVASVDGQFDYSFLLDDGTNCSVLSLQRCSGSADFNGF